MRIRLRTSGGRGEYELTGRHGPINHWDLKGKHLRYEFGLGIGVPGFCRLSEQGGKPRLRLETGSGALHLYRLAAAVLLMPPPVREFSRTTAENCIGDGSYSISSFGVKVISLKTGAVGIEMTDVESQTGFRERFDVLERLATVVALWDWACRSDLPLAKALQNHRKAIRESPGHHKGIESSAKKIFALLGAQADPLPELCGIAGITRFQVGSGEPGDLESQEIPEDDPEAPFFSISRLMRRTRRILDRGAEGARFRKLVRKAYRNRCLATGIALPPSPGEWNAGVEAAHLYPFSRGGANRENNGILLSPAAHWAFDQGFLRLDFEMASDTYRWSWNEKAFERALELGCELDRLDFAIGKIDPAWLPEHKSKRPKPAYLKALSELLGDSP